MSKDRKSSSSSDHDDDHNQQEETLANDLVVTKYGMAADIVNDVLKEVISQAIDGAHVSALCDLGDKKLTERTQKVFKKEKNVKRGIAFPTCISVNHCICHFSPLRTESDVILHTGNVVKIDLGAHIDGYIATAAHTIVVGATVDNKVSGKIANAISAAYNAMEVAIRMLRPGLHKNMEITDAIQRIADIYQVKPVENMLSHQLKRNKIDGDKQIIQNPGEKQRSDMEKAEFETYEAYAIDILMSTGEGKAREQDTRTTVYKKADDVIYSLKMKASRAFFSDAVNKFGSMPFTLRAFEDEKKAKMGVVECERHALFKPYQVFYERDGEFVVQFKSTVLLMPNGIIKITGLPLDTDIYSSDVKIEDEKLAALLASSLKPNKKKARKSKLTTTASNGNVSAVKSDAVVVNTADSVQ